MNRKIVFIGVALLAIGIVAIIFSLVKFPFQEQEPYDVPKSSVLLEESFVAPTTGEISRTLVLNAGDEINIEFRVTSGGNRDVDFYFRDGANLVFSIPRATSYNDTVTINNNSTYYAVWDTASACLPKKLLLPKYQKFGMKLPIETLQFIIQLFLLNIRPSQNMLGLLLY